MNRNLLYILIGILAVILFWYFFIKKKNQNESKKTVGAPDEVLKDGDGFVSVNKENFENKEAEIKKLDIEKGSVLDMVKNFKENEKI